MGFVQVPRVQFYNAPPRGPQAPAATGYADEALADSPLLYWRLGEASGTTTADASGNNRVGTVVGCTLGVAGALVGDADTAYSFDNTDDRVTSSYSPFVAGLQRTFEVWAYRDTSGFDAICGGSSGTNDIICGLGGASELRLRTTGTDLIWASAVAAGGWHHVVLTYDDTTKVGELYVDGTSLGTRSGAGGYAANSTVLLGDNYGPAANVPFGGDLDEFAIYDGILSSTRIAAHYDAGT